MNWDSVLFVLQGGEDGYYTDEKLTALIRKIKEVYPDCALTLSIGEKSEESYRAYKEPVQTAIFCGMRPRVKSITANSIQKKCPAKTAKTVLRTLKNWAIRQVQALWWVLLTRPSMIW